MCQKGKNCIQNKNKAETKLLLLVNTNTDAQQVSYSMVVADVCMYVYVRKIMRTLACTCIAPTYLFPYIHTCMK